MAHAAQAARGETPAASRPPQLSLFASVAAVALIVVYLVFVSYQWLSVDSTDLTWARRSTLLSGLEALAFTAAGAVLGTTVQRQVTKRAEDEAARAKEAADAEKRRAEANAGDAEKGRALHRLAKARASGPAAAQQEGQLRETSARPPAAGRNPYDEILSLAEQYGPV